MRGCVASKLIYQFCERIFSVNDYTFERAENVLLSPCVVSHATRPYSIYIVGGWLWVVETVTGLHGSVKNSSM